MELNWNQEDPIIPFFNDPNELNANNNSNNIPLFSNHQIQSNPLKMNFSSTKLGNQTENGNDMNPSAFKLIPLPDDIFGFDPDMNQPSSVPLPSINNPSNLSFNIDSYIKTDIDTNFLDIKANVEDLASNIDQDFINEDIEKVLLDLGISEAPSKNSNCQPQDKNKACSRPSHKRQLSGSAIFGFVCEGDSTHLSIPGVEPVQFINKKPLYKDVTNFSNLDFTNSNVNTQPASNYYQSNTPSTPKRQKTLEDQPDYYVSGGNPRSYKFPPSPPRGSFAFPSQPVQQRKSKPKGQEQLKVNRNTIFNPISAPVNNPINIPLARPIQNSSTEILVNNREIFTSSPIKTISQSPNLSSPINAVSMSSPLKKNPFQTPLSSPRKNILMSQIGSQSKFKISKFTQRTEDSTILMDDNENDDNEKTISAMATPSKKSNQTYAYLDTPTKRKVFFTGGSAENESTKENGSPQKSYIITQKIKGFSKQSKSRKKPTIATTLATGTLDQYFEGPDENKKYICKFFDKELQCVCNREFGRISNIRAHIQTHLSDRPFVCDICEKAFVRNHDLKRHKNGHSGVANTCPCGKTFPRADALKRHRMRNICIGGIEKSDGVKKPREYDHDYHCKATAKISTENANRMLGYSHEHSHSHPKVNPLPEQRISLQSQPTTIKPENTQSKSNTQSQIYNGYQQLRDETPIIQLNEIRGQQTEMNALFNFNEIPIVEGDFNFDLEDSMVM